MRTLCLAMVLAAVRPAAGDPTPQCPLEHPLIATSEIVAGCPLVVYTGIDAPAYMPEISDSRGTVAVPIQITIQESTATLDATTDLIDEAMCVETMTTAPAMFRIYTISLMGAQSGDWLEVDGGSVPILDAGPCVTPPAPMYSCGPDIVCPLPTDDEPTGCSSTSSAHGGLALVAFALVGLRRRRNA